MFIKIKITNKVLINRMYEQIVVVSTSFINNTFSLNLEY